MQIREHQPGDLGWIISKHGEIYSREFDFDAAFETNIADKVVKYFSVEDDFSRVWIATVEGERAGSIAVRPLPDAVAFIHFVIVLDRFRGMGIARALMEQLRRHAADHGKVKLRLETYDCLEAARLMYRDQGFEVVESTRVHAFGRQLTREFWERAL